MEKTEISMNEYRVLSYIKDKKDVRVILSEAMIAEIEHQANEGRSIGFTALEELKKLRELSDTGKWSYRIHGWKFSGCI